jgi:mRNA-degrading endonuclease toxin of MazEF toxin-antitoxin module
MPDTISNYLKNFTDWFDLKPQLDSITKKPLFNEREVWNCHFGVNLGYEIDEKSRNFLRPVLILKKLSKNTFIGIPLTSKRKNGTWYIDSNIKNIEGSFIIAQIKTFDSNRLNNLVEQIGKKEFTEIKNKIANFIKY